MTSLPVHTVLFPPIAFNLQLPFSEWFYMTGNNLYNKRKNGCGKCHSRFLVKRLNQICKGVTTKQVEMQVEHGLAGVFTAVVYDAVAIFCNAEFFGEFACC